jgi:hypothetical protein
MGFENTLLGRLGVPSALAPFGHAQLSLLDEVCVLPRPFCILIRTTVHLWGFKMLC